MLLKEGMYFRIHDKFKSTIEQDEDLMTKPCTLSPSHPKLPCISHPLPPNLQCTPTLLPPIWLRTLPSSAPTDLVVYPLIILSPNEHVSSSILPCSSQTLRPYLHLSLLPSQPPVTLPELPITCAHCSSPFPSSPLPIASRFFPPWSTNLTPFTCRISPPPPFQSETARLLKPSLPPPSRLKGSAFSTPSPPHSHIIICSTCESTKEMKFQCQFSRNRLV